ncbi:hypothetical protein ACP6PM_29615 [Dapis sp. BLCC M229]
MASIVNWAIVSKLILLKKSVKNPIFPLDINKIDTELKNRSLFYQAIAYLI